ncbi:MAG: NUDIX hydrolase [Anaerolineae bacterium]|nr:NUDIX hydrolase [Anaerolineae bacterium]
MARKATRPYAVRALLIENERILLIHHNFRDPALFGKWTFPGGRLDPDETDPLETLHREMQEELSVDIEVIGEIGRFYSRSGADYLIFAVRPLGPIGPLQTEEIRDSTWLTPAELYEWHAKEKMQFGFEMKAVSLYLKKYPWP